MSGSLFGPLYQLSGSGWSTTFEFVGYFGLTHIGIARVAQLKKIDVVVLNTAQTILSYLAQVSERRSGVMIVCKSGFEALVSRTGYDIYTEDLEGLKPSKERFQSSSCCGHVIPVVYRLNLDHLQLAAIDPEGNQIDIDSEMTQWLCEEVACSDVEVLQLKECIQPSKDKFCYAYALYVAEVLGNQPHLSEKLFKKSFWEVVGFLSSGSVYLPRELRISIEEGNKLAAENQRLILKQASFLGEIDKKV